MTPVSSTSGSSGSDPSSDPSSDPCSNPEMDWPLFFIKPVDYMGQSFPRKERLEDRGITCWRLLDALSIRGIPSSFFPLPSSLFPLPACFLPQFSSPPLSLSLSLFLNFFLLFDYPLVDLLCISFPSSSFPPFVLTASSLRPHCVLAADVHLFV